MKIENMKTGYEMWLNNELTNLGSFAQSLLETYVKADSNNQVKLANAFPEWFELKLKS